jgi:hypothetical protein
MKLPALITLSLLLVGSFTVSSQTMDWTKQIITGNSGRFEYSPPYNDFVAVQSYDPVVKAVNQFNTVFTQSGQDILIVGNVAFFNAQDSIIKYNLNTFQRMAAIPDSGLARLGMFQNRLIVSKQYPLSKYFVEVLDTANLSLIAQVDHISGDCGGVISIGDTVYVAVNGGWMGTEGKIAVIDPSTWTLSREINLGANAIGIFNLYKYDGKIYSVNKTPYGMPAVGSVSAYDPSTGGHINQLISVKVSNGTGIQDSTLYFMMNEGIGSFRLNSMKIADTTIVRDPGSAMFTYILSSAIDTLNNRIYTNIGDFITPGYCLVSNLAGDSITSFSTGISSDVVGVDYRKFPVGVTNKNAETPVLSVYPNPAVDRITLRYTGKMDIQTILITDIFGKTVFMYEMNLGESALPDVPVANLPAGLYCLMLKTSGEAVVAKFMKR